MQLIPPNEIELDSVSTELIGDAYELARLIETRRPLPAGIVERVRRDLLGERVYNSNAIEGNSLSLRETKAILETGQLIGVGRRRDGQEAINLGRAIERVQELVRHAGAAADESEFCKVHGILLSGIDDAWAGRYRLDSRMITGARYQPPDPDEVPNLMASLFKRLSDDSDVEPIVLASWGHWGIARVHPFVDGNGRMARLWQDLIFFSHDLVPAVIRQEDRTSYYQALEAADGAEFNPLLQVVTRSLASTLQIYVNALQEEDEVSTWAGSLLGEVHERIDDQRKLEFARWSNQMVLLRDAFERCAVQINKASTGDLLVEVHRYPLIEQSTWETLRAGTGASKTWFFRVFARRDNVKVNYIFFFGHHFYSDADSQLPNIGSSVCLLVSEDIGEGNVRLYEFEDAPITIRELLVIEKEFARKRWDAGSQEIVYDTPIAALKVAQDFFQEMILARLSG